MTRAPLHADGDFWPRCISLVADNPAVEARIADLLARMSIKQKIGQMVQAEIGAVTPAQAGEYYLGSVLNGGGSFPGGDKHASVADWLLLADEYFIASQSAASGDLAIPIIWGTDAVHGHNNVFGATVFPHNIGLGAMCNPDLMEQIGAATAKEIAATGIDWTFAPTLAVVRDDRWGRAYEGYSEDAEIVCAYASRMVCGLQGNAESAGFLDTTRVIATAKHFIGEGGTDQGIDQGENNADETELRDIHGQGYFTALAAGVQTVMATFSSWGGTKVHGHRYLLTDVLKQQMGFDGFVVSDWNGFKQVADCRHQACRQSINAGVDMLMVPDDWKELIVDILGQVQEGGIPMSRIDDAVTRILRVKVRAGLLNLGVDSEVHKSMPSARTGAGDASVLGAYKHRRIARHAVRESLVLLKNKGGILPLQRASHVLVAGEGADDIGRQSGGWTLTWQGTENENSDFPGAVSIFKGIESTVTAAGGTATLSEDGQFDERPDVAIVVFGEAPYAEGQGDRLHLSFSAQAPDSLKILRRMQAKGVPVVSVFLTGRPLWVNPELNASDAFVVAWLPGSEGGGVSDVLFCNDEGAINYDFKGRLSFSWPRDPRQVVLNRNDPHDYQPLFAYGFGLGYADVDTLDDTLPVHDSTVELVDNEDGLHIFQGRAVAPFEIFLGDHGAWKTPVKGRSSASHTRAIQIKNIDRNTQEDARQIRWNGAGEARLYFQSRNARDLSKLAASGARLSFQVRIDQRPQRQVSLCMNGPSSRLESVDLTTLLNDMPLHIWQKLSFNLSDFSNNGVSLESVDTPFLIWTDGGLILALAEVEILPGMDNDATEGRS